MNTVIAPKRHSLAQRARQSVAAEEALACRLQDVPVGVPESLQTMNANLRVPPLKQDIGALERNVRSLAARLEAAHRDGRAGNLHLRPMGGAPRLVMTFEDNGVDTVVDECLLGVLGETARSANRIYLHGHTDDFVASETSTTLAIRRTVEVRRLLVSLGAESERIRLFYRGIGNFLGNNSTPEGRALNRRVEIELRRW